MKRPQKSEYINPQIFMSAHRYSPQIPQKKGVRAAEHILLLLEEPKLHI